MATYSLESGTGVSSYQTSYLSNDEVFTSLSGATQTRGRSGCRWMLTLIWLNATGDRGRIAKNYGPLLNGMRNRLSVNLANVGYIRVGAGGGTPTLNGAHSAGATSLTIQAGPISTTDWLKAGDYISVANELKQVTIDVSTNGAGAATVTIFPELHKDYSTAQAVEITSPVGVFYLANAPSWESEPHRNGWMHRNLSLSLIEDVLA